MAAAVAIETGPRPSGSKLDLINATVAAISRHGLSSLTSAKIAGMAGHTAASINFHFGSKEALLLATLREVSEEFAGAIEAGLAERATDPLDGLQAIIDASLSPQLSDARKVAVWYAFLAESGAREDYQRICGDRDKAYSQAIGRFCAEIVAGHGGSQRPDADAVALGLVGLIDQIWQDILFQGDDFDREAGKRQCRAYLASVFPWLGDRIRQGARQTACVHRRSRTPEPGAGQGLRHTLPGWVYHNEEFFELERERLLLPSWQIACHVSELARTGDYVAFEFLGERGFVVRDGSGAIRAFHNVCSHRAHAVVGGKSGHCPKFIACPYHGWTYHLDGRNRSVSAPDTFPKFDRAAFGLKPIETEVFMGLVFVRFRPGEAHVAERLEPFRAELSRYRIEEMVPLDDGWENTLDIDWKNVVENYVEDYHFPMGHPGLSALMESDYDREVTAGGAMRLSHRMRRAAAEILERRALCIAAAARCASAEGHAAALDVFRTLPQRVLRCVSRVARFLSGHSAGAGARAPARQDLRLHRRTPGNARGPVPQRAHQRPGAGRGRGPDALRAAGPVVQRLHDRHPLGQGDRARRIPGLDPGTTAGGAAADGAGQRQRKRLSPVASGQLFRHVAGGPRPNAPAQAAV